MFGVRRSGARLKRSRLSYNVLRKKNKNNEQVLSRWVTLAAARCRRDSRFYREQCRCSMRLWQSPGRVTKFNDGKLDPDAVLTCSTNHVERIKMEKVNAGNMLCMDVNGWGKLGA